MYLCQYDNFFRQLIFSNCANISIKIYLFSPAEMRKAFQEADANKNGSIDNGEVRSILRRTSRYYKIVSSQVSRLITTLDRSRDGKIQYSELRPYLCKYTNDNACGKEYY